LVCWELLHHLICVYVKLINTGFYWWSRIWSNCLVLTQWNVATLVKHFLSSFSVFLSCRNYILAQMSLLQRAHHWKISFVWTVLIKSKFSVCFHELIFILKNLIWIYLEIGLSFKSCWMLYFLFRFSRQIKFIVTWIWKTRTVISINDWLYISVVNWQQFLNL